MNVITEEDRAEIIARCRWVCDSGHEWLQVPVDIARQCDQADRASNGEGISAFSYVRYPMAYLEGDCDAAIFLQHWNVTKEEAAGMSARAVVVNGDAPVRRYARWGA